MIRSYSTIRLKTHKNGLFYDIDVTVGKEEKNRFYTDRDRETWNGENIKEKYKIKGKKTGRREGKERRRKRMVLSEKKGKRKKEKEDSIVGI